MIVLASCGGPSLLTEETRDQHNQLIAKGDRGVVLPANWLLDKIHAQGRWANGGDVPQDELREFFDSLLLDTLTGLAADDLDLDNYPGQVRLYRRRYRDFLVETYINERFRYPLVPDSADIVAFYNRHPESFHVRGQVSLYQILISPQFHLAGTDSTYFKSLTEDELEDTVRAAAWNVYGKLQGGEPFDLLAEEYSHDALTNSSQGYVGWTIRGVYFDPFDSVAFSLSPGEFAEPYRDQDGWHIIMIDDRIDEGPISLDRPGAWDNIKSAYIETQIRQGVGAKIDTLMRSAAIEYRDDVLDRDPFKEDDTMWVAVVNDIDTIGFELLRNYEIGFRQRFGVEVTTPDIKRMMIGIVAGQFLLARTAMAEGIDTLPRVVTEKRRLRHLTSKAILEGERFDPSWLPTDSMAREYYEEHIDDYTVTHPVSLSQIVCNDSVLAEYLYDLAASGYDFESLPEEYVPPGQGLSAKYEYLGPVREDEIDRRLIMRAKSMRVGGVGGPVGTDRGYHVLKLLDRSYGRSYDQARSSITSLLKTRYREESVEAELQRLVDRFNVTFPNRLPAVRVKRITER
jgi:hypothetical protein